VQNYTERSAGPSGKVGKVLTKEPKRPKYISYPREPRRQSFNSGLDFDYDYEKAKTNWIAEVKTIEAENRRRHEIYCAAIKSWYVQHNWNTDWEPHSFPKAPLAEDAVAERSIPELPNRSEKIYEMYCPECGGKIQIQAVMVGKKRECPLCHAEIVPVFFRQKTKQQISPPGATIQEAAIQQNNIPGDYTIPARLEHVFTQRRPAIQKPTAYSYHAPIERFAEWVEGVIERNLTFPGGNWLPAGPLNYAFAENIFPTISFSRQIADTIESKGYCVEPDARFGSGTYGKDQTLALFKPLDGDPIQPSTAYLGAANLLRLCILITTADGTIDLVELDLFRQAIENQVGLTLTDHKRLLILEQLLAQELCSATKTAAKIAKAIPADKRLAIGHLLVQVAGANHEITKGERRVLEQIFYAFEISQETLGKFIGQVCPAPWLRPDSIKGDVSKNDKWLWNHWRTGHPGVVIDDDTLAGKTWNFTDWKALNARWRDLHERLVAQQFSNLPSADSSESDAKADSGLNSNKVSALDEFLAAGRMLGASAERRADDFQNYDRPATQEQLDELRKHGITAGRGIRYAEAKELIESCRLSDTDTKVKAEGPTEPPVSKHFALDMERVYQITNETKEVVAILSVVMADEPEESIQMPTKITLPVPETPQISGDSKDAPQPTRFNGLDAAFHPILERLLTRDSWPTDDFNALAREFHFMPGKICETINEWSDETLGEFILDGDAPVVIRRELIANEKIYG
jgi:uncharacterized tellurite resistance protein B-like protein